MRFAQGKLREGSVAPDEEILRCAQDDSQALSMTGLDLSVDAELSSAFEPCLRKKANVTYL